MTFILILITVSLVAFFEYAHDKSFNLFLLICSQHFLLHDIEQKELTYLLD